MNIAVKPLYARRGRSSRAILLEAVGRRGRTALSLPAEAEVWMYVRRNLASSAPRLVSWRPRSASECDRRFFWGPVPARPVARCWLVPRPPRRGARPPLTRCAELPTPAGRDRRRSRSSLQDKGATDLWGPAG